MRLPVPASVVLLAALVVGAALPGAASAAPVALGGSLVACGPAKDTTGGSAVFKGSMPLLAGAAQMQMRFDLEQRASTAVPYAPVTVPKWGVWQPADAGVPGFVFRKRVVGLVGPAAYRAVVRFRWLDAAGAVLRTVKRTTAACVQPDPRPDLSVGAVVGRATAADPTVAIYRVVVRNTGRGAAGPFAVTLGPGGGTPVQGQVDGMAKRSRTVVELTAPACAAGTTIDVAVDPQNVVAEADESDDTRSVACPLPSR